jgi:hypothetical protein
VTHLEVLEKVPNSRLYIKRIQPKRKYPSLPLSLRIEIFNLGWCLCLFKWSKSRMIVE